MPFGALAAPHIYCEPSGGMRFSKGTGVGTAAGLEPAPLRPYSPDAAKHWISARPPSVAKRSAVSIKLRRDRSCGGSGLYLPAPNFVLLGGPSKFRLQGDKLFDQPIERVGVAGLRVVADVPLDTPNVTRLFELCDNALDMTRTLFHAPRDRLLCRVRVFVGIPPVPDYLKEDVELDRIELQLGLRPEKQAGQGRVAELDHGRGPFVGGEPALFFFDGELYDVGRLRLGID